MDVPLTPSPSSSTMKLGSESSYSIDDGSEYKIPRLYYADAPQNAGMAPKSGSRSYDVAVILTLSLHLLVVLVHCMLLVIWATAWEQRILVNTDDTAHICTIIDAILQVMILVLTTALIAVMAPLAIRTQFLKPQTLTALSDVSSSWNGLGISALTLYHNIRLSAAFFPVLLTTIYFLALTGLHITTPLILTIPIVEVTRQETVPTVIGTLDVKNMFPSGYALPSNFSDVTFDWYRASASLDLLNNVTCDHLGLKENRVYDTLITPLSSTNASATVAYTDFNVKCGQLPQEPVITSERQSTKTQTKTQPPDEAQSQNLQGGSLIVPAIWSESQADTASPYMSLSIALGDKGSLGTLSDSVVLLDQHMPASSSDSSTSSVWGDALLPENASQTARDAATSAEYDAVATKLWAPADILVRVPHYTPAIEGQNNGRNIFLYSVFDMNYKGSSPILDSSGAGGPRHMLGVGTNRNQALAQVIGCSLSTENGYMTLDATTNRMRDPLPSNARVRLWDDWLPDNTSSNSLADMWGNMFSPASSMTLWRETVEDQLGTEWSCLSPDVNLADKSATLKAMQSCHIPTVIEQYLTDSLFGIPHTSDGWLWNNATFVHTDFTDATLITLEDTLSRATATVMWIAARARTMSTFTNIGDNEMEFRPEPQMGSTVVQETLLKGRLTINFTILALGTAASIILLLIAIDILAPQVRTPKFVHDRAPLDGVSLLQVASLDTTPITERLADVDPNATEARRRAGLFPVIVVDGKLVPVANLAAKKGVRMVVSGVDAKRTKSHGDPEEDEGYLLGYATK
ncbi:hypothetical protein OF83DRAFT_761173 [Amylostereum chailletii]|nr:hypothetical protein OF83DRAFT_761173 [Amylostereum chailletii]